MTTIALPIVDPSHVAEARRHALGLAGRLRFSETQAGKVALVVTELTRNVVTHTPRGGRLLIRAIESATSDGVELVAVDGGPGMGNIAECLRDGYSTAGTLGTGLGAIVRLSDGFDVFSLPGLGTALVARIWADGRRPPDRPGDLILGGMAAARSGEDVSGDDWAAESGPGRLSLMLCDGLGHGVEAAQVSREACAIFRTHPGRSPAELMTALNRGLRKTRGGAIAVAAIDGTAQTVRFCGVGNISAVLVRGGAHQHLTGHDGIVGHTARTMRESVYPWPADGLLVMHTDGCATHWRLDRYPGLAAKDPSVIAGILYRDFERGRDDAAVTVVRRRLREAGSI